MLNPYDNPRSFCLLLFCLSAGCLFAQGSGIEQEVYRLFEKPGKVKWVQHYKGRFDDLNDFSATLASDGKNCKGFLTLLRSKEKFRLDGTISKNALQLQEIDQTSSVSGHFRGFINDATINGDWSNFDNSIGKTFRMERVKYENLLPTFCGDNKWVHIYKGTMLDEEAELLLQKDNPYKVKGILFLKDKNISYPVNGEIKQKGAIQLNLFDSFISNIGKLEASFVDESSINGIFTDASSKRTSFAFELTEATDMGCIEYADYIASYDITFPKSKNTRFNRWMEAITWDWIAQCRKYTDNAKKRTVNTNPQLRATLRAHGWSNVDLFSDEIISGFLTFGNTWSNRQEGRAFNFDLRNGKEIAMDDIFISSFDWKGYLKQYVNKAIEKHRLYKNYHFRKWLAKEEFPHFIIRKDGISFCTNFDTFYGQHQLTIPYSILKPYIKGNSPVSHLVP